MLAVKSLDKMDSVCHYPVMWKEVIEGLKIADQEYIVDCTTGLGGHAYRMLAVARKAFYVGIDKDAHSLQESYNRLRPFLNRFVLLQDDFKNVDSVCQQMRIEKVDTFFFDLGMSSYQLDSSERGFSFLREGFLDMRFDQKSLLTASDLVNNLSERELVDVFRKFGQERYAKKIAQVLVNLRKSKPVLTTLQLSEIIKKNVPPKSRFAKIHPATRIFQALRIAVNSELESLEAALPKAVNLLKTGGRIGVISFHSLEDRIVKHTFRNLASQDVLKIITKKPEVPTEIEKRTNPASRSAKLRIAEKIK